MGFEAEGQRAHLGADIQAAFATHEDGALVVSWFLVAEVRKPSGGAYLAYRSGDLNNEGLRSWTALGFLHSATNAVEESTWGCNYDPGDHGED